MSAKEKKYFYDFYGGTASITIRRDKKAKLIVRDAYGGKTIDKVYDTERGAKIAMGRCSDGWREKE